MKKINDAAENSDSTEMDSSLFFTCGHVVNNDVTIIPAGYNIYPDEDMSRVVLRFGDDWLHHDVDSDLIISTTFEPVSQTIYLLGRHGLVRRRGGSGAPFNKAILTSTKFEEERIDTKNYGVLYCIRAIKGNVYACGQSSQVYMRADGHWGPVGQGITNDNSITFESIDGNGADDIYAVGQEGAVFHFNGYRWRQISFPTNRPLSSIRCISKQEVYICGNDGLFFKGHDDSWEDLTDVSKSYNFWDVEIFQNCVYLSHHKGIVVFDGQIHADVDFRMQKAVSCHKLHANDGCLWSFGVDDLLKFDGSNWMEVLCPENEPRAGE